MQSFANFSRHAFKRIAQRTLLSCEEIAEILDRGLVVNTGQRPGFDRVHLLFYSHVDNDYFVAIQDVITGTVITILPLDYHETLAWKINEADRECAREILLAAHAAEKPSNVEKPRVRDTPKVFVIAGQYLDEDDRRKTKLLLKTPCDRYDNDLKKLLGDNTVIQEIERSASDKGIPIERMFAISVRHGKRGVPMTIDLRTVSPLDHWTHVGQ
jgi:hypothetical protein